MAWVDFGDRGVNLDQVQHWAHVDKVVVLTFRTGGDKPDQLRLTPAESQKFLQSVRSPAVSL